MTNIFDIILLPYYTSQRSAIGLARFQARFQARFLLVSSSIQAGLIWFPFDSGWIELIPDRSRIDRDLTGINRQSIKGRSMTDQKSITEHKEEIMSDHSAWFSVIPFALVVIAIIYEKSRQKKLSNEYDEMQLRIRGKSAWYAFYGSVFYLAVVYIIENVFSIRFLSSFYAVFLGVMISGCILVGYSIMHDSYYGMNRSGSRNLFFILLIGAADTGCVICFVRMLMEGVFRDLKTPCTDDRLVIVLCIPLLTTILVTTLIRHLKPEEEEE